MKLISMKNEPKEMEQKDIAMTSPMDSAYPYGLKLYLDNDILKKLGIKELPEVGTTLMLSANVEVCDHSQSESQDGTHRSMGIQITDMALDSEKQKPSRGERLYGEKA